MSEEPENDHERWAENEAKWCDRMVGEYQRTAREWAGRDIHHMNAEMFLRCTILAETYAEFADRLRRPRYIRAEQERLHPVASPMPWSGET